MFLKCISRYSTRKVISTLFEASAYEYLQQYMKLGEGTAGCRIGQSRICPKITIGMGLFPKLQNA
jgi:hypothetical protein